MKLSIFTTATNPEQRGDLFEQPLECYQRLADEIVIMDGTFQHLKGWNDDVGASSRARFVKYEWPREFWWPFIGQQFQRGYEACTGDWVIHADLDFIFHEQDYDAIRFTLSSTDAPAVNFLKYQFILPDRYNLKSRLVMAVNKRKYGDRIRFDSGGDLCQPSLDGREIKPGEVPGARIPFYNYEKILKTREQVMDDAGRMARAYERHFGERKLAGPDDQSALDKWLSMTVGRFKKPQERVALSFHPRVMQETIAALEPEQWGYSGWGLLGENDYV